MVHYKLTYFDLMGRGEAIRLMFAYAGVPFEDKRVSFADWPAIKPTLPYPVLPMLEVDGRWLQQSLAIYRYLGKQFGLVAKDDFEAARCDMLADGLQDCVAVVKTWFFEPDPDKKKQIWDDLEKNQFVPFCKKYDQFLKDNNTGFFVGNSITWFDFMFYSKLAVWIKISPGMINDCPNLKKWIETIEAIPKIKNWLVTRPQTEF